MLLENNKALGRRWLRMAERGFKGDFGEYFTPDYVGHVSGQAPQSLDELVRNGTRIRRVILGYFI
jgi:hypothetical protein